MSTVETLLTAEEFAKLPSKLGPLELVNGRIIKLNVPGPRHGQLCARLAYLLESLNEEHDLGHVVSNDTGVICAREPDTVRGADVAFYSDERAGRGPLSTRYLSVSPELVFEVTSPSESRAEVLHEVGDYLSASVEVVCVVDSQALHVEVHRNNRPIEIVSGDDALQLADVSSHIEIPMRRIFA